jgi:hypothetical protein
MNIIYDLTNLRLEIKCPLNDKKCIKNKKLLKTKKYLKLKKKTQNTKGVAGNPILKHAVVKTTACPLNNNFFIKT